MTLVRRQQDRALLPYKVDQHGQETKFIQSPVLQLKGHNGIVNDCKFTPDGRILGTVAFEAMLWSINIDQQMVENIGAISPKNKHRKALTSITWNIDGTRFAVGSADSTIAVIDTETGKTLRRFRDHKDIVNDVDFFRENPHLIVSGDDGGNVMVHDIRDKECVTQRRSNSPVIDLAVKGTRVAVGGVCGNVYVNDIFSGELKFIHQHECEDMIYGLDFNEDGNKVVALDCQETLSIFDSYVHTTLENRLLSRISFGSHVQYDVTPTRVAWHQNYVICGSSDSILRIYDVLDTSNPTLKYELPGHKGPVTGVAFHPTVPIVASTSADGTCIVGELDN